MGIIVATDRVPLPFDRDCARTASRSDATVFVSPTGAALRPRKDAISRGGDDVGALAGARVGVASLRERTPTGATDDAAAAMENAMATPVYLSIRSPSERRTVFSFFLRENPNPRECARDDARRRGDAPCVRVDRVDRDAYRGDSACACGDDARIAVTRGGVAPVPPSENPIATFVPVELRRSLVVNIGQLKGNAIKY
jgi:hypothetical protein